jgi:hypothetical protein
MLMLPGLIVRQKSTLHRVEFPSGKKGMII